MLGCSSILPFFCFRVRDFAEAARSGVSKGTAARGDDAARTTMNSGVSRIVDPQLSSHLLFHVSL